MKLKCVKDGYEGGTFWTRDVEFPFPPFPGMVVGCHVVKEVQVCQSNLDGQGDIEVHLEPAERGEDRILEDNGWEFHS